MPADNTHVFQSNFKIGNDLHNVYASSAQDFLDQLDFFQEQALPKIVAITQAISGATNVAAALPVAPAAQQGAVATPPAAAPAEGQHICDHGQPMRLVPAGISKATNKPYKAFYACAQPRGQQCDKRITVG